MVLSQKKENRVLVNLKKKCVTEAVPEGGKRRKSRKKRKRKTRKKRKRKTRKKRKRKTRKRRKRGGVQTETWDHLINELNLKRNVRRGYIERIWVELADPTSSEGRMRGCETYLNKNRKYKVKILKEMNGGELTGRLNFEMHPLFKPDEVADNCVTPNQTLSKQEFEFATKTGDYKDAEHNQWVAIKNSRSEMYDMMEH